MLDSSSVTCNCAMHGDTIFIGPEETPFDVALKEFEKEFRARPPKRRKCPRHKQYACQVPGCR